MTTPAWMWMIFLISVGTLLILDLLVFHRQNREMTIKQALLWSAFWIATGVIFNIFVYFSKSPKSAAEFLAAYIIEKSLSVDNLFVFILIFAYFGIPRIYQHKVLFWGILGVLVTRCAFIMAGLALISLFHWMVYALGGLLIWTGIKILFSGGGPEVQPEKNLVYKFLKRFIPLTADISSGKFFIRENGRILATVLFLALIVIESTDVLFAVDSVPAVLAISQDPFIAYTSNVFAILGLRALFFAISATMQSFCYLRYGLAIILSFIGIKMVISAIYKMPTGITLGFVATVLAVSIVASILKSKFFSP